MNKSLYDGYIFLNFLATIDEKRFEFIVDKFSIMKIIDTVQSEIDDIKIGKSTEENLSFTIDRFINLLNSRCMEIEESSILRFDENKQAAFDEFKDLFSKLKGKIVYISFNPKKNKF